MDDTVLPVFEPDAALLIATFVVVAGLAVSACARHGFAVNFAAGKSEVLLSAHGLRAKACRELLVSLEKPDPAEVGSTVTLFIVSECCLLSVFFCVLISVVGF